MSADMRHFPRRSSFDGTIEIVERQTNFVRAALFYDYRYTCNAQQWDEAERICRALETYGQQDDKRWAISNG